MAHFAELDANNVVKRVIVVSNSEITDGNGNEIENDGILYCQRLYGGDTRWKQTSYNGNMRKRHAGIGMIYNEELNAFISRMYSRPGLPHNRRAGVSLGDSRPNGSKSSASKSVWRSSRLCQESWRLLSPDVSRSSQNSRHGFWAYR